MGNVVLYGLQAPVAKRLGWALLKVAPHATRIWICHTLVLPVTFITSIWSGLSAVRLALEDNSCVAAAGNG